MRIRQWEIWKATPPGFETDHWFVIVSGQERLDSPKHHQINGLACYTLRGELLPSDVRLNAAEAFAAPTACQCDLLWFLDKRKLQSSQGMVSWERQQAIKSKLREVFRL